MNAKLTDDQCRSSLHAKWFQKALKQSQIIPFDQSTNQNYNLNILKIKGSKRYEKNMTRTADLGKYHNDCWRYLLRKNPTYSTSCATLTQTLTTLTPSRLPNCFTFPSSSIWHLLNISQSLCIESWQIWVSITYCH